MLEEISTLTGNNNTAGTLTKSYLRKEYIQKIRRNLYVAVNLADNKPAASRFRIAKHITPTAYLLPNYAKVPSLMTALCRESGLFLQ
jgi:hypothetical protein